jgi:hypothetical protein
MKMKHFIFLFTTITLTSCATLFTGVREVIHIDSYPQGAKVSLNNKEIGITPLTAAVRPTMKKQHLSISKPGYDTKRQKVDKRFNYWSVLSLYFFPVDLLDGSAFNIKEKYVNINLDSKNKNQQMSCYYIINQNNDSTYILPKTDSGKENLNYKTLTGQEKTMPLSQIKEYKTLEVQRHRLIPYICYDIEFKRQTFISVPVKESKKKTVIKPLEKVVENGEYMLLIDYYTKVHYSSGGYGGTYGGGSTSREPVLLIYKNNEEVANLKNKDCLEYVKKYFNNQHELIKQLEKKPKLKTIVRYSANLQ